MFTVGVDVGGTFTDVVAREASGRLRETKVPTNPDDPARAVLDALGRLGIGADALAAVAHGTTAITNAIVEGRVARVGLVTTRGFRDVLEIGRQNRFHLYDLLGPSKATPLVPRRLRLEVDERIDVDGAVRAPLDPAQVDALVAQFRREGVEAVAVCLLHAYANAGHERLVGGRLAAAFPHVSLSSEVNAEFREYERTSTTVLNAAVMPLAARYIDGLTERLGRLPLHLLHAGGGMMSAEAARRRPLALAMSGPAAGVAAGVWVARRLGVSEAVALDMGGTTTDVCLITGGAAETTSQRRLGGHPVRLPMVAVESIGAGGGSLAFVDAVGALKVGPRSAGAFPGPACYGTGGTEPTVTDANVVLGYLNVDRVYGGTIRLDPGRAAGALEALARRVGLAPRDAAHGVVEIANASMLRALRLVSVQRGWDLRRFALIAYGGAGPLHAGALARAAGVRQVIVPAHSGAFSALGCLVSPIRYDAVQTCRMPLADFDPKPIDDRFRGLETECARPLLAEDIRWDRIAVARSVDLRYAGQNYELTVSFDPDPVRLRAAFEARHRQLYGYATGDAVEAVTLRVTALVEAATPPLPPAPAAGGRPERTGEQPAYFAGTGDTVLPRYARETLTPGRPVDGPALIEDDCSTTIVYPGQRCTATPDGDLVIEARP